MLLVDLDPQANATSSLGVDPRARRPGAYETLIGDAVLGDAVVSAGRSGLDLVPSSSRLTGAQVELLDLPERERRLALALGALHGRYQVTLIDCPPSLGILTLNGLVAADAVLAPVQCEYLALEGLGQLLETVRLVRTTYNERLELLGLLLTMHDPRTNLSGQVIDEVRRHFPNETLDTVIPRSVRVSEAPSHGQPVLEYDPTSRGAQAYREPGAGADAPPRLAHVTGARFARGGRGSGVGVAATVNAPACDTDRRQTNPDPRTLGPDPASEASYLA